jgi:hypothetical protein
MAVLSDSSIVPETSLSSVPSSPRAAAPAIKRTYGRPKPPPVAPSDASDAEGNSSMTLWNDSQGASTRKRLHMPRKGADRDEVVPPSETTEVADYEDNDIEDMDAPPSKFTFGWKHKLAALDADSDDDEVEAPQKLAHVTDTVASRASTREKPDVSATGRSSPVNSKPSSALYRTASTTTLPHSSPSARDVFDSTLTTLPSASSQEVNSLPRPQREESLAPSPPPSSILSGVTSPKTGSSKAQSKGRSAHIDDSDDPDHNTSPSSVKEKVKPLAHIMPPFGSNQVSDDEEMPIQPASRLRKGKEKATAASDTLPSLVDSMSKGSSRRQQSIEPLERNGKKSTYRKSGRVSPSR